MSSNGDEWMTPPEFLELVRKFYNSNIELDPASNTTAQRYVKASEYYSIQEGRDGLTLPWSGRKVFCNPPYSRNLITSFVEKVLQEVDADESTEVIMLVNSSTDTEWYHKLANRSDVMLLWRGRLKFWKIINDTAYPTWHMHDTGKLGNSPRYLNTVFYMGQNPIWFSEFFKNYGTILKKY